MDKKIIVIDYDPKWKIQFEELKSVLINHIGNEKITIEHVGSTSIQGMSAKPIIDLDIIIEHDNELMKDVIQKLREIGYNHVGDLGVTGREAFKRVSSKTPDTGTDKNWFEHHLYLGKEGSIGLQNHIRFRNYMRNHPEKVKEYGELKIKLAKKHPYDIDAYVDGKTDFILRVLDKTGMNKEDRDQIDSENRLE